MKLEVFDFIDKTRDILSEKREEIEIVADGIMKVFEKMFKGDDYFLNITNRVKSEESLKEKILRQNYFLKYGDPKKVIDSMSDLIGLRIECRFIKDEASIYKKLKEIFYIEDIDGYFYSDYSKNIKLKINETQPQKQHNGFDIYKIDGKFETNSSKYHFELQIKSFVNIFWGDIDHRILYKNYSYVITEEFIREVMYSIKDTLTMVDSQLMVVYNKLYNLEEDEDVAKLNQLKKFVSKIIHDIFLISFKDNTGILLDFRKPIDLIVEYLFANARYVDGVMEDDYFNKIIMKLNKLKKENFTFGSYIELGPLDSIKGNIEKNFGLAIYSLMNLDLKWNLILTIIFELESDDKTKVFISFIEFIVYLVTKNIRKTVSLFDLTEKEKR